MPLRFQRTPVDVLLVLAYTIIVSLVILLTQTGTLWALLLVTFVPGYVTVAALFPGQGLQARLRELLEESEDLAAAAKLVGVDRAAFREGLAKAREVARSGKLTDALGIVEESNDRFRKLLRAKQRGTQAPRAVPERERREPGETGIDWIERFALSFALSIALVSLLVLLLNFTPFGIRLEPIVGILLLYTILLGAAAAARRIRLPVADRLAGGLPSVSAMRPPSTAVDKALALLLAASLVFAAAVVAYVAVTPRPRETFSELYRLDANGTLDPTPCPEPLVAPGACAITIVVVNHEGRTVPYSVGIDLWDAPRVGNVTNLQNRTTLDRFDFTLDDGGNWTQPYTFAILNPGRYKVDILLFRDNDFRTAYRNVFFFVNVTAAP